MKSDRVWLITGASTGFGRALAGVVLDSGATVVATARDPETLQFAGQHQASCMCAGLDVTRESEIEAVVAAALERYGRIDVLVNNAGYGLVGAAEELDDTEVRDVFETNFFGAVNMTKAVLPSMRAAGRGQIVNISSVCGFCGFWGLTAYTASKFALEGFSESLASEVRHLGLRVLIVEPGSFRTDFHGRSLASARRELADYAVSSGAMREQLAAVAGNQVGDPVKAATAIVAAVESDHPPLRLALGADALEDIERKLAETHSDLERWRGVTEGTAFT